MADDINVTPSTTYFVGADVIGTTAYQRVKVQVGSDGTVGDVDATKPFPVQIQNSAATILTSGAAASASGVAVYVAASALVSGTITVSNGASVTIQQGASVQAVVSGTISVSGGVAAGVSTTAPPSISMTGQVMWLAGGQGTTANPVVIGGTVTAANGTTVVSGTVSVSGVVGVSGTLGVSAASSAPLWITGTVVAGAGTTVISGTVSISNQVAVSGNVGISGAVSISVMPAVSISVSAALGTVITILGTQIVSVVPGLSVNALVTGVVSVSVLPAVSISVSAALGTVITVLGTVAVNVVAGGGGGSSTTATPSVSATGQVMWIANSQAQVTTGTPGAAATGVIVWNVNPATVTVTVTNTGQLGTGMAFYFATTVSAPTVTQKALVNIAAFGTSIQTSDYTVPAGRVLRINAIQVYVQNTAASVNFYRANVFVRASTSVSTTVAPIYIQAGVANFTSATNFGQWANVPCLVDFTGGLTIEFDYMVTAATGGICGFIVTGNLF